MAIEQRSVEVGICDACRKYCPGGPNGEPPAEGVAGTVELVGPGEGPPARVEWFSCKKVPGHIGQAVRKVLDTTPDKGATT